MEKHPETVEGAACVPWEPLGQVAPDKLPEPSEKYPGPWEDNHRGNGHVDLVDGMGRYFAHVYCWDGAEWGVLYRKLRAAKQWAIENRALMSKAEAVQELKHRLDDHARKLDDERRPFDAWLKLFHGRDELIVERDKLRIELDRLKQNLGITGCPVFCPEPGCPSHNPRT